MTRKPKETVPGLSAQQIVECLRGKHGDDVFVTECKTGPSQTANAGCQRMDVWTMNRSWANALTTCYEVKMSRGDFLGDDKWPGYLPYCNAFYFACPFKMIAPEEVPAEAGLIWIASTGTRAFTKKKAPFRDVEVPESLWRYLLMCRTRVQREYVHEEGNAERWQKWLAEKAEKQEIGWNASKRIREIAEDAGRRAKRAEKRVADYAELEERFAELGIDIKGPLGRYGIAAVLKKVMGAMPDDLKYAVGAAKDSLARFEQVLAKLEADTP